MTVTEIIAELDSQRAFVGDTVTFCLFRDIHKGIRNEMMGITLTAGSTDANDMQAVLAVVDRVRSLYNFLELHAEKEDKFIGPSLELHLPQLFEKIETDHVKLDQELARVVDIAEALIMTTSPERRRVLLHRLYLDCALFTAHYLPHQDLEETQLMPQLEKAIGFEAVLGMHMEIVGSIPPQEMAQALTFMLPAMNVDDRVELLGAALADAPNDVRQGLIGLTCSVLPENEFTKLAQRLGLA